MCIFNKNKSQVKKRTQQCCRSTPFKPLEIEEVIVVIMRVFLKSLFVCCTFTGSPGRHLTRFSHHNVSNTTTLLLSTNGDILYVGARDAVLALDVSHGDTITLRNKVGWGGCGLAVGCCYCYYITDRKLSCW